MEYTKDIILESNLTLRRNIEGFDFPASMSLEDSLRIVEIFREIYGDKLILLDDLDENTKESLIKSFVLTEDVDKKLAQIALVFDDDYILTINDRDHVAINIRNFNLDAKKAYKIAGEVEKTLDETLDFAFTPDLGYLCQDARNAGAGLEIFAKVFLFALVDDDKAYFGLKQSLIHEGIYISKFLPKYYKRFADDIYLIKNVGNYRKNLNEYIGTFEKNMDILVRNERRFRRDYMHLNHIRNEEIEDYINIMVNNIKGGFAKSLDLMAKNLYGLKKYRALGFDTDFSGQELDYLLYNLEKNKYKGNRNEERYLFLEEYIKER